MRPPKKPTQRPPEWLSVAPRGMWYEHREGKPLPYLARWRYADGVKDAESFATPEDRAAFAADWLEKREKFGKASRHVDADRVRVWTEFDRLVGGANPLTVAREWLEWRGSDSTLKIEDAWTAFNDDQEKRKLSGDTHSHRRLHGKRLCAYFAGKLAGSITSDDLDGWLAQLKDADRGEPLGTKSRAHHLKNARHFFEWLKDRRKIAHNPCDAVTTPDATELHPESGQPIHKEINIMPVKDAAHFFQVNRDALCVGRLALEAFGGLRYTSAARLHAPDIAWEDHGIVMPGHRHKSGVRHYVDGWPANLWQWMKHAPKACWDISPRQYAELKREAFERAGLKPPQQEQAWTPADVAKFDAMRNVFRHSFASYHLAAYKDAKLTAHLLTKTSINSLNNDYRGRATKAQGEAYLAIVP